MQKKNVRADDDIVGDTALLIDHGPHPTHEMALLRDVTYMRVREEKEHVDRWGRVVLVIAVLILTLCTFFLLVSLARAASGQLPMHIAYSFLDAQAADAFARYPCTTVLFLQSFAVVMGMLQGLVALLAGCKRSDGYPMFAKVFGLMILALQTALIVITLVFSIIQMNTGLEELYSEGLITEEQRDANFSISYVYLISYFLIVVLVTAIYSWGAILAYHRLSQHAKRVIAV